MEVFWKLALFSQSAEEKPFCEETKKAEECVSFKWMVPESSESVEKVQNIAGGDGSGFIAELYGEESLDGCGTRCT